MLLGALHPAPPDRPRAQRPRRRCGIPAPLVHRRAGGGSASGATAGACCTSCARSGTGASSFRRWRELADRLLGGGGRRGGRHGAGAGGLDRRHQLPHPGRDGGRRVRGGAARGEPLPARRPPSWPRSSRWATSGWRRTCFDRLEPPPEHVRLILVRAKGDRQAGRARPMALRAIARARPHPGAVVVVEDGDAVLPPGCLERTLPFFRLLPRLAALTTDEDCLVPAGGARHAGLAPAALRPAPPADVARWRCRGA